MARRSNNAPEVSFNDRLILFRYFLAQFGHDKLKYFAGELNKPEFEGIDDETQNTKFYAYICGNCPDKTVGDDKLRLYDENICRHTKRIGENRGGITLKYYQYISLLFTEMYLDRYFLDRDNFIKDLNEFIDKTETESLGANHFEHYTAETMNKIAFMCATGSGKTLIMHINILQYLHYMKQANKLHRNAEINRIIVLAPNEGMSRQHLKELELSSIPASIFSKDLSSLTIGSKDIIVIDMNKFKEEGKVKTVSVDSFERNNLVLVDEGHRGLSGDVWKDYRDRLSEEGFAFEYSATFKQALRSQKTGDTSGLMEEYGKAIIMDYSYKYFYEDGYGKDYRIYNLRENFNEEQRQLYLVGCLMSYYQQLKLFATNGKEYAPYHIEKPLLVFVGNRVTASTSKTELTDVEEALQFIDGFVRNKAGAVDRIAAILSEDTGLKDNAGNELFYNDFAPLMKLFDNKSSRAEDILRDMLRLVFNTESVPNEPRLHLVNLKQADGEIALRIADNTGFGVISVGDTSSLLKLCEERGLVTETDEFNSGSLFAAINNHNSKTNILIGSRKFSEGWNSWRVSTMGLINFAKGEGSQAIQLFGRGVRLRGYEGCLKRSGKTGLNQHIPRDIDKLETLTIFGIKAQYMEDFRKYLEMEDLDPNPVTHEFMLKILNRFDTLVKGKKLQVIQLPDGVDFRKQSPRIVLDAPDELFMRYLVMNKIVVDCCSKVQTIESSETMHLVSTTDEHTIEKRLLKYLDYDMIYDELERYKNEKHYYNIIIDKSKLCDIMGIDGWYGLIIPAKHIEINSIERLGEASGYAVMVLKLYIDKFFKFNRERWEAPYVKYFDLTSTNNSFEEEYQIKYTESGNDDPIAEAIGTFVADVEAALNKDGFIKGFSKDMGHNVIVALDFPKHLYTPLLTVNAGSLKIQVAPIPMNEGEADFVRKLNDYVEKNIDKLKDADLYLLRNKSKTGMGFFEAGNFFPDFVLWIVTPEAQKITFVDPKGLIHIKPGDPKIMFYKKIKDLQERLQGGYTDGKIILNSFIMSSTKSAVLQQCWAGMEQQDREDMNVYCLDSVGCVERMVDKIIKDK